VSVEQTVGGSEFNDKPGGAHHVSSQTFLRVELSACKQLEIAKGEEKGFCILSAAVGLSCPKRTAATLFPWPRQLVYWHDKTRENTLDYREDGGFGVLPFQGYQPAALIFYAFTFLVGKIYFYSLENFQRPKLCMIRRNKVSTSFYLNC
jgi:hypothetical protein